jgi:hypothetical protein
VLIPSGVVAAELHFSRIFRGKKGESALMHHVVVGVHFDGGVGEGEEEGDGQGDGGGGGASGSKGGLKMCKRLGV